jgi:UDP-N-acetylmuramate dehydrogenase
MVRDGGFDGLIIKLGKNFNKIKINKDTLSVGAGVLDVNLAKFALKNLIKDFEFFSGIPGTIGGAIKMNAGCYGSQTADNLKRILVINKLGKIEYLTKDELELKYRSSNLTDELIVLKADFICKYSSAKEIIEKKNYIKLKRESSQPIKEKTSGSTFKNPSGEFAAALIEKAGCKGMKNGGASVSEIHSNFIINNGEATALDIENLGKKIIKHVYEKFGITLEWEIKIIGT